MPPIPRPLSPDPDAPDRDPLKPISQVLRAAARAAGSIAALAQAAGVDARAVRRWIKGDKDLTLETADRLAVALRHQLAPAAAPRRPSARPGSAARTSPQPLEPGAVLDGP